MRKKFNKNSDGNNSFCEVRLKVLILIHLKYSRSEKNYLFQ
jgi:hypothetical protein